MSIAFVQSAATNAGIGPFVGGVLSCAYTNPNGAGNVGIVVVGAASGSTGATVTDTQGNAWTATVGTNQLGGNITIWVCLSLTAGANTVSVSGLSGLSGGPSMGILEYSVPANSSLSAFQPPFNAFITPLALQINFQVTGHTFQTMWIVALYDTSTNNNGFTPNAGAASRVALLESGGRSIEIADQSKTTTNNAIVFTPSSGSYAPAVVGICLWVTM